MSLLERSDFDPRTGLSCGVSFVIKYMLFVVKSLFNFCFTINDRHFITNNTFPRDDPENGHKYFLCWKYQ